jgi:hypothetical protein
VNQNHDSSDRYHSSTTFDSNEKTAGGDFSDDDPEDRAPKYGIFGDEPSDICNDNTNIEVIPDDHLSQEDILNFIENDHEKVAVRRFVTIMHHIWARFFTQMMQITSFTMGMLVYVDFQSRRQEITMQRRLGAQVIHVLLCLATVEASLWILKHWKKRETRNC